MLADGYSACGWRQQACWGRPVTMINLNEKVVDPGAIELLDCAGLSHKEC